MLESFLASWSLFAEAWIASWLIAGLLGLLGVAVLARDQVFLGAAMSQAATAGVALVVALSGGVTAQWIAWAGGGTAVLAAVATALGVTAVRRHPEGVTAWIFLAGASSAVLLVARSPHGMEEVNRLVASSLVGAGTLDVVVFALLFAGVLAWVAADGRRLRAALLDPVFAAAVGVDLRKLGIAFALVLGAAIGWSLHVAGLLYTFGCLVLPALAARCLARELRTVVVLAPVIAVLCAVVGSLWADASDLPPAQVTVALLAATGIMARIGRFVVTHR